jgi:PilZ domain
MKKREYERYIVEFPVRFVGDCEGVGIVYNLGMGGCKIVTDRPLSIGAMVALFLNVPGHPAAIQVRMAAVRWILRFEGGIQFLGMEEMERERLAQYLRKLAAAAA